MLYVSASTFEEGTKGVVLVLRVKDAGHCVIKWNERKRTEEEDERVDDGAFVERR